MVVLPCVLQRQMNEKASLNLENMVIHINDHDDEDKWSIQYESILNYFKKEYTPAEKLMVGLAHQTM